MMNSIRIKSSLLGQVLVSSLAGCGDNIPDYMNPGLPVEKRVSDLLKRMTLEEKTAQMIATEKEVKDFILISEEGEIGFRDLKEVSLVGNNKEPRQIEIHYNNKKKISN